MTEDNGRPLPVIKRPPGVPPTVENTPAPAFGNPPPKAPPAPTPAPPAKPE